MIEMYYRYGSMSYAGSTTITNEMITGKYKIRYDTMYIQIKEKNPWLSRLLFQGKYWCHYISEDSIYFTETEYFDCKVNK